MVEVSLSRRSFHHAGVLIPTLETCCSQLVAAAGQGPFSAAREALLMTCCQTVLDVMSCSSYKGRVGASGSEEQVRTCDPLHRSLVSGTSCSPGGAEGGMECVALEPPCWQGRG